MTRFFLAIGTPCEYIYTTAYQMIVLLLEDDGFTVVDKSQLGPTPIVRGAITSGEIDIYPEYTGNGAFFFEEADDPL